MEISIWQYESLLTISLYKTENEIPFINLWFVVRDKIRYVNYKRGSFLEFTDFLLVKNRGYYIEEGDVFVKSKFPMKLSLELTVEPEISIRIV